MSRALTIHRAPPGRPDAVRIVPDGFRPSVFLVPPAALVSRGLWGCALVWLALISLAVGGAVAGLLTPVAALAAVVVVHVFLALDAADRERARLRKRGWSELAEGSDGANGTGTGAVGESFGFAPPPPQQGGQTEVIGLFPGGSR